MRALLLACTAAVALTQAGCASLDRFLGFEEKTCIGQAGPCTAAESISIGGVVRTYRVHLPASHDGKSPQPAIVVLHGRLGSARSMERLTQFQRASDAHGFVLIEPDGLYRSWADPRGVTPASKHHVDDLQFLTTLIDRLPKLYAVDRQQVSVAGMSNGAFMATALACQDSPKVSAVALVAGGFSDQSLASCHPAKPVAVLMIEGDSDPFVPYAGGPMGDRGVAVGAIAGFHRWAELDGCSSPQTFDEFPDVSRKDDSTAYRFTRGGCEGGVRTELVTVQGGGHTWPGGPQYLPESIVGRTDRDFDATELISTFLAEP